MGNKTYYVLTKPSESQRKGGIGCKNHQKCDKEGTDQFEALMEQRNTPRQDTGLSPCEMMFGRPTRTRLPKLIHSKMNRNPKREQRKKSVKRYYNKTAHNKPTLKKNQNAFFERKQMDPWQNC